jgi:periplasmic protein TonB
MDLFQRCFTGSFILHVLVLIIYYGPSIFAFTLNDNNAIDAGKIASNANVDVDFIDSLPASIILGGDTNPAPVQKEEWVEGTGKDKPDALNTDVNINKLSGTGTDADGYMFADLADRPPIPIIDFNPNDYFPKEARSANIFRQSVKVRLQVNENGSINSSKIISPPAKYGFDEAAIKVVSKIKFRPGKEKGKPKKMWMDYDLIFEFED